MHIWLPPSEGKTPPRPDGPPLDLSSLLFPELTDRRQQVLGALSKASRRKDAGTVLGLGPKTAIEACLNWDLPYAPCAPTLSLFTGVLFESLDHQTLNSKAGELLNSQTWILSALFGFVRPTDRLPNHRLSMGVKLPPLGSMPAWWRPHLEQAISVCGQTVFDCRPSIYQNAFPGCTADVIRLAVVRENNGRRSAVTHLVKQWRGRAVRWLLEHESITAGSDLSTVLTALTELRGQSGISKIETSTTKITNQGGSTTLVRLVTT